MKKNIITIFLLAFAFIQLFAQNQKKVNIYLNSAYLEYNNHVGNDWYYEIKITTMGKEYKITPISKKTLSINTNDNIVIKVVVVEDDKIPDFGSNTLYIKIPDLKKDSENIFEIPVIVRENRGRYAGNSAKWVFSIEIELSN
jgi:hypothetical protein